MMMTIIITNIMNTVNNKAFTIQLFSDRIGFDQCWNLAFSKLVRLYFSIVFKVFSKQTFADRILYGFVLLVLVVRNFNSNKNGTTVFVTDTNVVVHILVGNRISVPDISSPVLLKQLYRVVEANVYQYSRATLLCKREGKIFLLFLAKQFQTNGVQTLVQYTSEAVDVHLSVLQNSKSR